MNPMKFMQFMPQLERFRDRHPKFIQFFSYAAKSIAPDSILEITVTDPQGKKIVTNIRVDEEDITLFRQLKEML